MSVRLIVSTLLLAGLLSGCSSTEEDYCQAVDDHRTEITDIVSQGTPAGVLALLSPFADLAEKAPADIGDEWQQVLSSLRGMQEVFDDTGIDPATYDPEHPPAGLGREERQRVADAADGLSAPETGQAMNAIEQQVRDVCHTPLGL